MKIIYLSLYSVLEERQSLGFDAKYHCGWYWVKVPVTLLMRYK